MINKKYCPPSKWAKGFFSIEMIMVLVIALTILASAAGRINQLFSASNSASAASNVLSLQTAVQCIRTKTGYGEDGTDLLQALQDSTSLPSGINASGNKAINEWGGEITITAQNNGFGFVISYAQVPSAAASSMVTQLLASSIFSSISVDSTKLNSNSSASEISKAFQNKTTVTIKFSYGESTDS